MRLRLQSAIAVAASLLAVGEAMATTFALLPVRRGVRQGEPTELVEHAVREQISRHGTLVAPEQTRAALRRLRLRAPDGASAEQLRELAAGLGADWLLAAAVHDAPEGRIPDLTLSARLYDGRTGRLAWAGAIGRSGLDDGRLLGRGVMEQLDELAPVAVADLLAPLFVNSGALLPPLPRSAGHGVTAIVPMTASGAREGLEIAMGATEVLRAVLVARGVALAEPGCVSGALRSPAGMRWGELDAPARRVLQEDCGAQRLVTGAVERWEIAGSGVAPEPIVAVALRSLDVASGRILWTGSIEAGGWERESWFGRGRVFSRGEHLRRLLDRIVARMLAADGAAKAMKESN